MWTSATSRNTLLALAPLLLFAFDARAQARDFGRVGIGVKVGESAGLWGGQVSVNLTPQWQIAAGTGVTSVTIALFEIREGTDSYFLLAKRYFGQHWYAATGATRKITYLEERDGDEFLQDIQPENGIPFFAGYEFGNRRGFHFTASYGYTWLFGGGGRLVRARPVADAASSVSARSGFSAGFGLGYYFW